MFRFLRQAKRRKHVTLGGGQKSGKFGGVVEGNSQPGERVFRSAFAWHVLLLLDRHTPRSHS